MLCLALLGGMVASCDMMEEDRSDCPAGLYVTFKYDYNLQRADMFNDHVGAVTLYIFDEQGKLVKTQEEGNAGGVAPLKDVNYMMHVDGLQPGKYNFIALAGQIPYSDMLESGRAKFVRGAMQTGSDMKDLEILLDRTQTGTNSYDIVNNALPLDTLWHGLHKELVQVYSEKPTYTTVPLVRDTKKISVTLRELDDPTLMDIANYDMTITDHNSHLLWDNSLDETDKVTYTPHATWNTDDRETAADPDGYPIDGTGRIGHADFMTSRIMYHENSADDGILSVVNKTTGMEVARLNLPDILSRLRTSEELYRYSEQEFLDRGYDYDISLFLKGDKLAWINISISVLGWSRRIQFEELQ